MIINCPYCNKKFDVNESLIPNKGRLLQCGSCNQTWFYNKNQQNTKFSNIQDSFSKNDEKDKFLKTPKKRNKMSYKTVTNIPVNKGSEIVKYQPKLRLNFSKFLSYFVVSIISFFALIIVIDTFKSFFFNIFPYLEFYLFSLYETLKDVELFIKDLS